MNLHGGHFSFIEKHYTDRSGWLRAAVLGANDGILSTTSLVIGVAAASSSRTAIVLSALSGLVAGALSMAAGEYVSVSSQSDIEQSDLKRERRELEETPEEELEELTQIYAQRGLTQDLAKQVAIQMTEHNALEAHARDELGINDITQAKPMQAALASLASFVAGGILPFLVSIFAPIRYMVPSQYVFAIIFLVSLGIVAAKTGGSNVWKSVVRICFWGTAAMGITAFIGYLFGTSFGLS
ncbi:MAG: VIT family protein [Tannerella sp.]|jgi:VIT1/CCC1 family predicted Fe2+/Mn2+ transporter|nr:VIT family protein [Tannerella sp.]